MRALSTTQLDVDRSFEKAIYTVLLQNGYIADRTIANPSLYDAAMAAIRTSKGFAVDLYGNGSPEDREGLKIPKIVITGQGFIPGSVGREFYSQYDLNQVSGTYTKYNQGTPLSTYRIRVELWSNNTNQDRLIESVRQAALPNLSYIPKWDDPTFLYLIQYGFTASVPELRHGLTHKIYTYEVLDLSETELNEVESGIAPISEIAVLETDISENVLDLGDTEEIVKVNSAP